jgi:hypothetical protein
MATTKISPSFIIMFSLRQHIAPVEWFYEENEKLPEKKVFKPKYAYFDRRARQHIIRYPTIAVEYLEGLFRRRKLQEFCREQGMRYSTVYGYAIKRKRQDGIMGYGSRPGYGVIRKLRGVIHPDDWFVFPEELE